MLRDGTQLRHGFELRNGWSFPLLSRSCGDRAPLSGSLGSGRLHINGMFHVRAAVGVLLVGGCTFYVAAAGTATWLQTRKDSHGTAKRLSTKSKQFEAEMLGGCIQLQRNTDEWDHGYHSGSVHVRLQLEDLPVSEVHPSQYAAEWALRLSAVGPDLPAGPMLDKSIRPRDDNQF